MTSVVGACEEARRIATGGGRRRAACGVVDQSHLDLAASLVGRLRAGRRRYIGGGATVVVLSRRGRGIDARGEGGFTVGIDGRRRSGRRLEIP
jgi:hypothetical protein